MLTAPEEMYTRERSTSRRSLARAQRRDPVEDFADGEEDGGYNRGRRRTGLRLTFRGGMPSSVWGRVATGGAFLAVLGVGWASAVIAQRMILRDERFMLQSGSSVITSGNHHVSRAQLLDVFGADIERNILRVSLDERKAELEEIPWVRHATVMRLLPDRIRVAVEERTPIAFVRQGGHIGLVDATGVLMIMGASQTEDRGYSFPVVTGISPTDPTSVRSARMKIFQDFTGSLDASGEKVSAKLSEVDLSNPEDVKALIPDHGADVLVHFGDSDYLERYRKYESHLGEWRAQYPKLSSVDMRYERQVVLEMEPGTAVPVAGGGTQTELPGSGSGKILATKAHPLPNAAGQHHAAKPRAKGDTARSAKAAAKAGHH